MPSTISAIFKDGKIEPSIPLDIPDGTPLSVTIEDQIEIGEWTEEEWLELSKNGLNGLSGAYGDDEPDYDVPSLEPASSNFIQR